MTGAICAGCTRPISPREAAAWRRANNVPAHHGGPRLHEECAEREELAERRLAAAAAALVLASDTVPALAARVLRAFGRVVALAPAGSPLRTARAVLGDQFLDVAAGAARGHLAALAAAAREDFIRSATPLPTADARCLGSVLVVTITAVVLASQVQP